MKKREIFIVVSLIIFGFLYQSYKQLDEGLFREGKLTLRHTRLASSSRHDFQKPEESFSNIESIEVINPAGTISILPSSDQTVRTKLNARIYQRRSSFAKRLWKKLVWKAEVSGSTLKLSLAKPKNFPYQRLRLDLQIVVPQAVSLTIVNSHGKTTASDLRNRLKIEGHFNDVDLRRIQADIHISGDYSDLQIHDISGSVTLNGRFFQVFGESITNLNATGRHCDLQLIGIRGKTVIQQEFGSLNADGLQTADIKGRHTTQSLKNINGQLRIENSDKSCDLGNLKGGLVLSCKRTRVAIADSELSSVSANLEDDTLSIDDSILDSVRLGLKRNRLVVRNSQVKTLFEVDTSYADIEFFSPALPSFALDLQTAYGHISADPSLGLTILRESTKESVNRRLRGPELRFRSEYGDIRIGKGDSESESQVI